MVTQHRNQDLANVTELMLLIKRLKVTFMGV